MFLKSLVFETTNSGSQSHMVQKMFVLFVISFLSMFCTIKNSSLLTRSGLVDVAEQSFRTNLVF